MKKILKVILITVVILGLAGGGLYFGYNYKQGKKTAQVVSVSKDALDNYWGDNISSYGEVTSDKSQTVYLPSGTEVLSVNVAAGDHVNEGDVLFTVRKESQDINSKNLEIVKANQKLANEQLKLQRLMDTKPAPTYVYSQDVYKDINYTSENDYKASSDFTFKGTSYKAGQIVAKEFFSPSGKSSSIYIMKDSGKTDKDGNPVMEESTGSKSDIEELKKSADVSVEKIESTYQHHRSTTYFDAETGTVVGETNYTLDGEIEDERKVPTGMNAQELADAIEEQQIILKHADLDLRKLENELDQIKNTDVNGDYRAKVSGTVNKVQNKDNYNNSQPFIVLAATDEYYITGSIGEFYLDSVHVGDTATISSWETGTSTEAVITSISDIPSTENNGFSSGNSNSSNYEFKATFEHISGIEIGAPVDISITPSSEEDEISGLYIPAYFVRKDAGGSYVMRQNDKQKLEKQYVKVGKSLWGYMIEIKKGVTKKDCLAFPYGNGAIEGIKCEEVESLNDYEGGIG